MTAIYFVNTLNDVGALVFARGDFLSAFDKPQRDAFAMLFLRLHHHRGNREFRSDVDDVRLYSRVLSVNEIMALYTGGPCACSPPTGN